VRPYLEKHYHKTFGSGEGPEFKPTKKKIEKNSFNKYLTTHAKLQK
jgi:hypothetical protein